MEPDDRKKIDQNIHKLAHLIDMEKLWPKLNTIFSSDYPEISRWENNWNNVDVKQKILLDIKTRGPRAFDTLVNGLKTTDQHNCVKILQGYNYLDVKHIPIQQYLAEKNSEELNSSEENSPSDIQVQKSTRFYDVDSNQNQMSKYRMRSNPRGLVLIISLIDYVPESRDRRSVKYDQENLKYLFQEMGFKVHQPHTNLSAAAIRQVTEEFSQNPELQFADSAFIFISSHGAMNRTGDDTVICNIDGQVDQVSCTEIINYFVPEKCEYLKNKPKIFMFQLCRGFNYQYVVHANSGKNVPLRLKVAIGKPGIHYSDMLIVHSTLSDCVAFRDLDHGSWFVQCLYKTFAEYACEDDVETLFRKVDLKMRKCRSSDEHKRAACQTLSLKNCSFKKCFINPGLFEDDE